MEPDHRRKHGNTPASFNMNALAAVPFPTVNCVREEETCSDATLLRMWKNGDIRGYNDLVRRYERPLIIFIYRIIRDDDDAKDVLQETFMRLYRSLDKLREDKNLKSWLYMTANNLSIDYLRKHKPGRVTKMDHQDTTFQALAEDSSIEKPAQPDKEMEETRLHEKIVEAIETLPAQQRMAMTLRSIKGLSLKEIAETMNSTEQTVGTTLFAARKKLLKLLKPVLVEQYGPMDIG